jgi:hypothetical protein
VENEGLEPPNVCKPKLSGYGAKISIASGRIIEPVSCHHEQTLACEGSTQLGVPTGRKPPAKE